MIMHFSREEAWAAYDKKYPQPVYHTHRDEIGQLIPIVPMPGGICPDRELDRIFTWASNITEVIDFMYAARGTAGMAPARHI